MTDYNASDTRQIKAAVKRDKSERALDDGVLLRLMTTQDGRAWMWRFLSGLHAFHTPYTGVNNATNFQCGEHSVGLKMIVDLLRACPDQYIFMMREANDGGRTDDDNGHDRNSPDRGRDDSGSREADGPGFFVKHEYEPNGDDEDGSSEVRRDQ
jgi:hypothetical protein